MLGIPKSCLVGLFIIMVLLSMQICIALVPGIICIDIIFKIDIMILSNKDLQCFYGCSAKTAVARRREIQHFWALHRGIDLPNLHDYHLAVYEGLGVDLVREVLMVNLL